MKRNFKLSAVPMLYCILAMLLPMTDSNAQGVTTAQMFGQVTGTKGEVLIAATIQAVHVHSGTSYGVYSRDDGRFNIPNMRIGGPYTIKVTYS